MQYRHSSGRDRILLFIGLLAATICGMGLPTMVLLFGDVLNAFVKQEQSADDTYIQKIRDQLPGCFENKTT